MRKTLGDLAIHMKELIPSNIPETYEIKPMFSEISKEEEVRKGVLAFREFLLSMYDSIIADDDLCNVSKKGKDRFSDETTITVEFPFLNNIKSILMNIVEYGVLSESGKSILIDSWEKISLKRSYNKNSTTKISTPQMIKGMRFLEKCGIRFSGIDLSVKKPDVSEIEALEIKHPDNPSMIIGWRVLGIAQNELSSRKNDEVLLRCDYRMVKEDATEVESVLREFTNPLSESLKDLVFELHKHYLDIGMKCHEELSSMCTHIIYLYKGKAICRFSKSFHNGYRMIFKTKNTSKYPHVIESFSEELREKIAKGYGCDRKNGTGHGNCQRGCEGFRFSLDESLLDIKNELEMWMDSEVESMQRKKKK